MNEMSKINNILNHDLFICSLNKIEELEKQRYFCHHNIEHFLNVSRIAFILNLEEQLSIPKELIYGVGLLHDIGRYKQYQESVPHEIASAEIAHVILRECGYTQQEIEIMTDAIVHHRNEKIKEEKSLKGILYRADKLSRPCFCCEHGEECDWKNKKKNLSLNY